MSNNKKNKEISLRELPKTIVKNDGSISIMIRISGDTKRDINKFLGLRTTELMIKSIVRDAIFELNLQSRFTIDKAKIKRKTKVTKFKEENNKENIIYVLNVPLIQIKKRGKKPKTN